MRIYIHIYIYNIKSLSSNENHDISYKVRMKAYQVQSYERKIVSKGEGKRGVRKVSERNFARKRMIGTTQVCNYS